MLALAAHGCRHIQLDEPVMMRYYTKRKSTQRKGYDEVKKEEVHMIEDEDVTIYFYNTGTLRMRLSMG